MYRVIRTTNIFSAKENRWVDVVTVIKSGFNTREAAVAWNNKKGNPGYTIQYY